MCCCPGRFEVHADGVRRQRDLAEDILLISDWAPDRIVSLVESQEFEYLGVPQLPEMLSARFNWQHWPLRDLGAPTDSQNSQSAVSEWFTELSKGKKILFHCAAGLGRTGTLAARLLIAAGQEPQEAITVVRTARSGTVESLEQETFLLNSMKP